MSDDAPPGVPEWVVTYGDMMSLLLTFFIMLVSMSEVASDQKYRAIMESLQQYLGYRAGPASPPGENFPLNSLIEALQTLGSHTNKELGRGGVRASGPEGEQVRVLRSREGERLRVGDVILFEPGRAELSDSAKAGLRTIARSMAGKPNKVEIRAHAAAPSDAAVESPSVLSYRRGRAVVGFLESLGISHERMRITAAGDTEPLPERTDERPPHHDRVEILLLDEFAETYIGPRVPVE